MPAEPDQRFTLANERTFLATIRTSVALIVAGLGVIQLLPRFEIPGGRHIVGVPLIVLGCLHAFGSHRRWRQVDRAIREGKPIPPPRYGRLTALAIAAVGAVALFYAIAGSRA
jgi:putative membrane protein